MTPRLYIASLLALVALIFSVSQVSAKDSKPVATGLAIVAEVGGEVISSYDVNNRIKFIIVTTRLSNTSDVIARVRPQVIRTLVDEILQVQEAKRAGIEVADDEVTKAIAGIEVQRGMPQGAIAEMLVENKIPQETFSKQIRAQLAWTKFMNKKIRPRVQVSEEEMVLASKKMEAYENAPQQEFRISAIALPAETPARVKEVEKLAEKLVSELRAGASFEEVSRQFHEVGAKSEAFWVQPEQLDPKVGQALVGATAGMITPPLRTEDGFTIIKVYDVRSRDSSPLPTVQKKNNIQLTFKEIVLKLKDGSDNKEANTLLRIAEDVAKNPGTCEDKAIAGVENPEDFNIDVALRTVTETDLPVGLKVLMEGLKPGGISTPLASDDGLRLYMLCERKEGGLSEEQKQEAYRFVVQQKVMLEAKKQMRALRRNTFIDVRE